mmetsp:Transcript_9182/g.18520  ORF Transcript_9182/g.18520 Transcript_9182/m.18520 type:complete len:581 (-) Transcript_9182:2-1744(-)
MQPTHEGEVNVLEAVRRDEVQAAVDHVVVVPQPVWLAPRHLVLGEQVLLEELLDVPADDLEARLGVDELTVARRVHQSHLQLVFAHRDGEGVEGRHAHRSRVDGVAVAKRAGFLALLALLLALALSRFRPDFLVILLESRQVLAGLGELALLHALADVPVDERALGVHKIELVVNARVELCDGRGVGHHRDGTHDLGEVATRDHGRRLVVDAALEAGRAPVDELDGALRLDGGDGGVDVLGDDVATVHQADCHVLSVAWVDLAQLRGRLEGRVGDLGHRELLVVGLLRRDDGRKGGHHEVDARVRHQVGLELGHVHVERTVEAEGGGERGDDLSHQPVEVGVRRALHVEVAAADVVEGLVVHHEGDVGVLEEAVGGEHAIVGLHDGGRNLGRRVDGEGQLRLAAVVDRQALEQQGSKARASATANGIEHEEALEACAVVRELANAVEHEVDDLLADSVVAARVIVGGVLLAGDQLLWVVQLAVSASANLIDDGRLEVNEHAAGDMLSRAGLREESVERIVATANGLVRGHLAIGLDAVLQAVQLPARVTGLNTGLAQVDRDHFTHFFGGGVVGATVLRPI